MMKFYIDPTGTGPVKAISHLSISTLTAGPPHNYNLVNEVNRNFYKFLAKKFQTPKGIIN